MDRKLKTMIKILSEMLSKLSFGLWGSWGHVGPKIGPRLRKVNLIEKTISRIPQRPFWELFRHLSSLGRTWDLKMVVCGKIRFDISFKSLI